MQSFMLQKKNLNLGPKSSYLGDFLLVFEKNIVIIEISILEFVKMQSFMQNKNTFSLVPYFSNFRQEFEKNYCPIWNQHLRICQNAKFRVKEKKNWDLNYMGSFGLGFEKIYCHIWNQNHQIYQNWSASSKGPGTTCSEGLGPDPGPLCESMPMKRKSKIFTIRLYTWKTISPNRFISWKNLLGTTNSCENRVAVRIFWCQQSWFEKNG